MILLWEVGTDPCRKLHDTEGFSLFRTLIFGPKQSPFLVAQSPKPSTLLAWFTVSNPLN